MSDGETFETGTPNPHLSLPEANTCVIARAYWTRAFVDLSNDDQHGWLVAQEVGRLGLLGAQLIQQMDNFGGILAFAAAGVEPNDVYTALEVMVDYLQIELGFDATTIDAEVAALIERENLNV